MIESGVGTGASAAADASRSGRGRSVHAGASDPAVRSAESRVDGGLRAFVAREGVAVLPGTLTGMRPSRAKKGGAPHQSKVCAAGVCGNVAHYGEGPE